MSDDRMGQVQQFKLDFEKDKIYNAKGHSFNQRELIELFEAYWDFSFLE